MKPVENIEKLIKVGRANKTDEKKTRKTKQKSGKK